jgi:hypothetical protein
MIKTINPWICNKCAWHNSEVDKKCRNKTCDNTLIANKGIKENE